MFQSSNCLASKIDTISGSAKVTENSASSFTITGTTTSRTPGADTRTIKQTNKRVLSPLHNISPKDAAVSMNSIDFLQELVKVKDTVDEKYYGINSEKRENQNQLNKGYGSDNDGGGTGAGGLISVVEYTGRLWFMNKRGVQFQESVKINNLSECGKYSTIECVTKYKRKNKWVDCSRVMCSFLKSNEHDHDGDGNNDDDEGLKMKVVSEILVQLPLLGAGRAVKKHITKTFEAATDSFFHRLEASRKEIEMVQTISDFSSS